MALEKSKVPDLAILEGLPPKVELRLLMDRFAHFRQPRKKVFDLVRKGFLELICRGHYFNLKSQDLKLTPLESLANALYFPSYVSAEWALQYYGLLTERVHTLTSVTPRKTKSFRTSLGQFEFQHLHKHRYPFGYQAHPDFGFMMALPVKALLDYLKLRGHDLDWRSSRELEQWLTEYLRIDLAALLRQTTAEQLRELIPHYHRNSKEARLLKALLAKKEQIHG
jgi:hypothetical protein